jgi:DNA-directed RNA polymerase specialized sigma24 family protein
MSAVHHFKQPEFRERVTEAILETLAAWPETHRNIFVWKHYRGYSPKQIAEILRWSCSDVEATLDAMNSVLYQRTRSLLAEDRRLGAETDLPAAVTLPGADLSPSLFSDR